MNTHSLVERSTTYSCNTLGYAAPDAAMQLERSLRIPHTLLVDVRPASSFAYEWHKAALASRYGERYRWDRRLGNLHYKSCDLPIALAPRHEDAIAELADLVLESTSLVLLCACRDAPGLPPDSGGQARAGRPPGRHGLPGGAPMTTSGLRQRNEIGTLQYAQGIYHLLAPLHVGDRVPEECSILDNRDGTIPPWQVYACDEKDSWLDLVLIVLSNSGQATLFDPQQWVARRVLAQSTKILAFPPYLVGVEGAALRGMLCDLVQQAHAVVKGATRQNPRLREGEDAQ